DKGFEIVFACEKNACGAWNFHKAWYDLNPFENNSGWNNSSPITQGSGNYYIAAKKKIAGNDTYVSILTNSGWWNHPIYRVDVAQISSLDTKVVPASKIEEAIMNEGRAVFYGITFDSGKSVIKAESKATLAQIAVFLKKTNGQFYVVGHTDDKGSLSNNMTLSQARAKAIVSFLIKKHGAPSTKLTAHGAGPLSPVASNLNDKGKALNRRVEIVQKLAVQSKSSSRNIDNIVDFNIKQEAAIAAHGEGSSQESDPQVQPASQTTPQAVQNTQEENLIPVPKVTGKWMLSGYKILLKQGFKVRKKGKKFGKIRKQSPAANTRVRKGSTVTITIGR
ncbi:MAG: OmpA family protein, partial [Elusimicrobiales bacterium]|nr:OmpA family protein [Elusimicrobiales bacterium]